MANLKAPLKFLPLALVILISACGKKPPEPASDPANQEANHTSTTVDGLKTHVVGGQVMVNREGQDTPYTGTVVYYFNNGNKKEELGCVNGHWKGRVRWWYESGKKAGEATMIAKDTWDGEYNEWFENGDPRVQTIFKAGKKDGKEIWWHESGQRRSVRTYKDGQKDGPAVGFFQDGSKEWECAWVMGSPNGEYREFFPGGELKSIIHYRDGKRHGDLEVWYAADPDRGLPRRPARKKKFVNGLIEGASREWWSNGKLKKEASYKAGKLDGAMVAWDESGKETMRVAYKEGRPQKTPPNPK